jgi:ArsR family transcriptional regulator, arsenate/arsenite/antimonite-responsive transcriptional repressor / arsenate reductase (thioredoxin)
MNVEQRAAMHHALGDTHRLAMVDALALSDRSPSDLATLTGLPTNLVAFHLDVLEDAGVITRHASEGDRRRRYVRLAPSAVRLAAASASARADHVLFVCTANSARSQLAAALWERATGRAAASAGTLPAARVHPLAIEVAVTHGLDLAGAAPQGYDEVGEEPDLIVSVCDRANETVVPFAAPRLHWSVPDPVTGGRADFEAAFIELRDRIAHLASVVGGAA